MKDEFFGTKTQCDKMKQIETKSRKIDADSSSIPMFTNDGCRRIVMEDKDGSHIGGFGTIDPRNQSDVPNSLNYVGAKANVWVEDLVQMLQVMTNQAKAQL